MEFEKRISNLSAVNLLSAIGELKINFTLYKYNDKPLDYVLRYTNLVGMNIYFKYFIIKRIVNHVF